MIVCFDGKSETKGRVKDRRGLTLMSIMHHCNEVTHILKRAQSSSSESCKSEAGWNDAERSATNRYFSDYYKHYKILCFAQGPEAHFCHFFRMPFRMRKCCRCQLRVLLAEFALSMHMSSVSFQDLVPGPFTEATHGGFRKVQLLDVHSALQHAVLC